MSDLRSQPSAFNLSLLTSAATFQISIQARKIKSKTRKRGHLVGYRQTQSPWSVSTEPTEEFFLKTTTPPSSFSFQPTE